MVKLSIGLGLGLGLVCELVATYLASQCLCATIDTTIRNEPTLMPERTIYRRQRGNLALFSHLHSDRCVVPEWGVRFGTEYGQTGVRSSNLIAHHYTVGLIASVAEE